jgi:acetyl esterase/lipase
VNRRAILGGLGALGLSGLVAGCTGLTTPAGTVEVPAPGPGTPAPIAVRYGPDPAQYGELHLPAGTQAVPVVVVVHGGYWRQAYGLELGTPLAVDLSNRGVAAWNIEYRRVGGGGGYPATFADVATAVDTLAGPGQAAAGGRLDLGRIVLLGHSAGGHLVGWAAGRERLPAGAVGASPVVRPRGTVAQAGVLDLVAGAAANLGGGAVIDLLGGPPAALADRYEVTSPTALVPAPAPVVCVHGDADTVVPLDQSERYVRAALAAGARARLRVLPGADHFALVDPADPAWDVVRSEVLGLL